ncbi:MAG: SDR family NAD(P)-dependent oxidoreductase [Bdellovibrionales bacterium]
MKKPKNRGEEDIAIIGMACWYPGAQDLVQLWENVLTKRRQFRRMLDTRLPLHDYQDDNPAAMDKTYGKRAAFLEGFEFDWVTNRFPKSTFESTDMVHWLALDVAGKALRDAGYDRKTVPLKKTGVLVGNSLTGESSRADSLRLRWPYMQKVLSTVAGQKGMSEEQKQDFIKSCEQLYKSILAPITEDTLAGCLANTIAGRICNYFNLDGGGYTVDGACASSLLAVANSVSALRSKDLDIAVAGGVDISLDAFELIGFAKVGALTKTDIRVYDRDGSGFIPGEGCGFVILKRLADAERDGNRIYATIKGCGISSDGNGGITAPKASGQATALKRAYDQAGYGTADCHFIEGHGTGTAVGDRRELEGIAMAMELTGGTRPRACGVTSLKSIVGHTKAAAGIGALIKATIGVNRRVLPPTSGCENPHPIFQNTANGLYPLMEGEVLPADTVVRAGVSAMGFGGINCHVTLQSYSAPFESLQPQIPEAALLNSHSEAELFVFSAQSIASLKAHLHETLGEAMHVSMAELTDLAADLARRFSPTMTFRASVIAANSEELCLRLQELDKMTATPPEEGAFVADPLNVVFLANRTNNPKVAFVFPGQGSQRLNMAKTLHDKFIWARELVQDADKWMQATSDQSLSPQVYRPLHRAKDGQEVESWQSQLRQTHIAQPAICLSSILWAKRLSEIGIRCQAVAGHSLGELTALHWAGAYDEETLIKTAALRGRLMSASQEQAGTMLSLTCDLNTAQSVVEKVGANVTIANINGPNQIVLSGTKEAVENALKIASQQGISGQMLNVSNAFHSPLVAQASIEFEKSAKSLSTVENLKYPFISSLKVDQPIDSKNVKNYLAQQIVNPVDWLKTAQQLVRDYDLVIEVGPGAVLSSLINNCGATGRAKAFPVESKWDRSLDLLRVSALYSAMGGQVNFDALFAQRLCRPYVPFAKKRFLMNPCERPFPAHLTQNVQKPIAATVTPAPSVAQPAPTAAPAARAPQSPASNVIPIRPSSTAMNKQDVTSEMVAALVETTGFSADVFRMEMRLLDDLNLDSIKAGEVISSLAKRCSLTEAVDPIQLANATLGEIVDMIVKMNPTRPTDMAAFIQPAPPQATPAAMIPAAPIVAPMTAPPNPVASAGRPVEQVLFETVSRVTGFDTGILKLEMRLLDDLNLDSIKAGEVIVSLKKEFPNAKEIDPIQFANATLKDICEFFKDAQRAVPTVETAPQALKAPSMMDLVYSATSKISGYPLDSLSGEMTFKGDLQLDNIQLLEIVRHCCLVLSIKPNVDIEALDQCSLKKMGDILDSMKVRQAAIVQQTKTETIQVPPWVRNFTMSFTPEVRPVHSDPSRVRFIDKWPNAKVLIIHEEKDCKLSDAVNEKLVSLGASVTLCYARQFDERIGRIAEYTHVLMVLPSSNQKSLPNEASVRQAIERLHFLTTFSKMEEVARRFTTLACIQQTDGHFNIGPVQQQIEQVAYTSTLQTLHIERPSLRVRCLDVALGLDSKWAAEEVVAELNMPMAFSQVGFDIQRQRLISKAEVSVTAQYEENKIKWTAQDVLLATGGAKGITAECALEFARQNGVKVALVGSSPPPTDLQGNDELSVNLRRFKDAGVTCQYFCCNIADAEQTRQLFQKIKTQLGSVTVILHGAGKNIPKRLSQVSQEEAYAEVAPKLLGALNLLENSSPEQLKMFIAFTSIIGVMGVPGNGWYGFSNEALNITMSHYRRHFHSTHMVACAFGMWDEVGMASKLGSGKKFSAAGVNLIPVKEGVQRFMQLTNKKAPAQQVVITARLWKESKLAAPAPQGKFRFLEKIINSTVGVEAIARSKLTLEQDLYLNDHKYRNSFLFPTVFGLEAMAQVAAHALGLQKIDHLLIEDLELASAVVVSQEHGMEIEVYANVMESDGKSPEITVKVGLRSESSKFTRDHFSATFKFNTKMPSEIVSLKRPEKSLDLDLATQIYGGLLFHGPLYRRLSAIHSLDSHQVTFDVKQMSSADLSRLSFKDSHDLILGDPYFRDALLQSAQTVLTKNVFLPIRAKKWEIFTTEAASQQGLAQFELLDLKEKLFHSNVVVTGKNGRVLERLTDSQGVWVRATPQNPTPEELAKATITPTPQLVVIANPTVNKPLVAFEIFDRLEQMSVEERHTVELSLARKAFADYQGHSDKPADTLQLGWHKNGKPYLKNQDKSLDISFSHKDDICVCVIATGIVGCDLESVSKRKKEDWSTLLGPASAKIFKKLSSDFKNLDLLGTLIWSAREAAAKAFVDTNFELQVHEVQPGSALSFEARSSEHHLTITTKTIQNKTYVLAIAHDQKSASQEQSIATYDAAYSIAQDGTGSKGFFVRWPVTFKDASNLLRSVYFSKFFEWQGRVRELAIWPLLDQTSKIFMSGEYGWVTNSSETKFFGALEVGDLVEVRVTSSEPYGASGSSVDAYYDWYRIDRNGTEKLVARSHMMTTWVKVMGHGLVEIAPFPPSFTDFFKSVPVKAVATPPELQSSREPMLFQAPQGVATGPILSEHVFETTLEDSNLVGNVYFSNYAVWLGRARDSFLHKIAPQIFTGTTSGEPFCTRNYIKHLREAMPFDQIQLVMRLQSFNATGLKLYFDFHQFLDGKRGPKIAFAEHELVWGARDRDAIRPTRMPQEIIYQLSCSAKELQPSVKKDKAA